MHRNLYELSEDLRVGRPRNGLVGTRKYSSLEYLRLQIFPEGRV